MQKTKEFQEKFQIQITKKAYALIVFKMLLCTALWGGTFVSARASAGLASPYLIGFLRFAISALFLIVFLEIRKDSLFREKLKVKEYLELFILGLSGMFLYNVCFLLGLQFVPASRASLIVANNPLAIALGAAIFLKERLSYLQILGIITSTCGAVTIISNGDILHIFTNFSYGDLLILGCVFTWTVYSLVGKVLLNSVSSLHAVTWSSIFGALLFLPFAFEDLLNIKEIPLSVWLNSAYLGIFGTAIGCVLFYEVMHILTAAKTGVFITFVPVFAVIFSYFLLGEEISLAMLIGGTLTILGVYLANKKH